MSLIYQAPKSQSDLYIVPASERKLIVGLGNIGKKYEKNRHNVGFMAVEHYVTPLRGTFKQSNNHHALVHQLADGTLLAKPTTMMNRSGDAVFALQNYYAIDTPNVLIISDDVDIDFGRLRTRLSGGSGGHNGLKSIIDRIGEDFARLRIGVHNEINEHADTADFVLSNFTQGEQRKFDRLFNDTSSFIQAFIDGRFDQSSSAI